MVHRDEILKPIWHAFGALDLDRTGKVSKSQLKVLSHNLCTVLNIPQKNSDLEEHFSDDDKGPVSSQGYMPYLNTFILDKIEYFLRKLIEATGRNWNEERFVDYKAQLSLKECLNAWELIELVGMGYFTKGMDRQTISLGIHGVFQELILDILKQGYMMKKGHKRKNWTERWFELRLCQISYYVSEDLAEKKGSIPLDRHCCVEPLQDKEGKKNLFIIKCPDKSFEISASDKKKRQEWIQAIQDCINRQRQGLSAPHKEAQQRRRELRNRLQTEQALMEARMMELQLANEKKHKQLEVMRENLEEAAARAVMEEQRRIRTQNELQNRYRMDLEKEKIVRQQMEEQVDQMSGELNLYLQRVRELEDMYRSLEEALEDERQARQDEESLRKLQARLLEEEVRKHTELEQIHLLQKQAMHFTQQEKEQLEQQRLEQDRSLQNAMMQLENLEKQRQETLEQYETVKRKLERAADKTQSWKDKVAKHEGLIRLIQPGSKGQHKMTNWGAAAFTDNELEMREKKWQETKNKPGSAL
ncbi:switch-associated protein 70 isoform X2 [Trichomycterus rosablanca]|uniref:switch-associated protein 70 isoform X2 n=1 Tax=Trichomycterus rosablanca TaxID=2290929 RepID=UPI002F3574F9